MYASSKKKVVYLLMCSVVISEGGRIGLLEFVFTKVFIWKITYMLAPIFRSTFYCSLLRYNFKSYSFRNRALTHGVVNK